LCRRQVSGQYAVDHGRPTSLSFKGTTFPSQNSHIPAPTIIFIIPQESVGKRMPAIVMAAAQKMTYFMAD